MRRAARAGVLLCGLVTLIVACENDAPTSTTDLGPVEAPDVALASASRGTPSHPRGIVEKVEAPSPWGVAVRDDGLTFFTELFGDGVGVTSTRTRTIDGFIPTGPIPTGIVFSPSGTKSYVANQAGNVSEIDVATRQVTRAVEIDNPLAVRVSPDGTQLFVATGNSTVVTVDLATMSIIRSVDVGFAPNGFAVHPRGRVLYASSFEGGTVSEIDMFTGDLLGTFTPLGTPQEMTLNRKGTRLYVANEGGWLDEFDVATGGLLNRIPLQAGAFGVGVTPDDGQAYLTLPGVGLIQVFTLQSRKLAKTIDVGGEPRRIAFSQQGRIAAVTNASGFITFIR